jgi:hypothetical protein
VPSQAEIIPFEPEQVSTCGGTKIADLAIFSSFPFFVEQVISIK